MVSNKQRMSERVREKEREREREREERERERIERKGGWREQLLAIGKTEHIQDLSLYLDRNSEARIDR